MPVRRAGRALASFLALALVLLAAGLIVPGPADAPGAPRPAAAVTTTVRATQVVDHRMASVASSPGTNEYFTSPAVADLDGDDRPEVVVAAPDGTVTATRAATGVRLWQRALGLVVIHASPVVVDIDANGRPDVVVATMDGRVIVLSGLTGAVRVTHRQGAPLHCPAGTDCRPDGFFATPSVADVNGDGRLDIVAPSFDHTVYAWTWSGGLIWRRYFEDTLWSSPAVADIDRDGRPEVIFGGDIYPRNPLGVPAGGLVWVVRGRDGVTYGGYPKSIPAQTVWSSPAVADLDRDGNLDVIVGTGNYYPDSEVGRRLYAFTARTRADLPGWPASLPGRVVNAPAIGDIDGDGAPEVVVASVGGYVTALEANGVRRWRVCNAVTEARCGPSLATKGGAVIADVDDDGVQELVSTLEADVRIYDGRNGVLEAGYRFLGSLAPQGSPAIAELDGRTLIVQSAILKTAAPGPPRAGDTVRSHLLTTDRPLCAQDWPAFKRDVARTSLVRRPDWAPFRCARPFVRQQYRDFLGREPDAGGLEFWTGRLAQGGWRGSQVACRASWRRTSSAAWRHRSYASTGASSVRHRGTNRASAPRWSSFAADGAPPRSLRTWPPSPPTPR